MKPLIELKNDIKESQIDLEENETFEDWWEAYLECLKEDKDIYIINGVEYVRD